MKYTKQAIALALCLSATALPGMAMATEKLTIDQAVQTALENNPAGKAAAENIVGAEYGRKSARSGYLPTVSASYSVATFADSIYQVQSGYEVQVASDTQYNWALTLVQPLFTGFAVTSQNEIARIQLEVSRKQKEQTMQDIIQQVKSACYHLLLTEKILLTAQESVKTLASHEQDAQRFYDHGVLRQNDLLRAKVALSNALQQQERAGADVEVARAQLNTLLVKKIDADTEIEPVEELQHVNAQLPALLRKGIAMRPQLQAMELVKETMQQSVKAEKSGYYPKVSLVGSYWQSGDDPIADNNDYENDHNASLTVQASWDIFSGFKTDSDVAKALSAERAWQQTMQQAEDAVQVEIQQSWLNLGVARHNVKTAKVALSQAEENMRITRLAYRQQAATSSEVLDAQSDLTGARTNYYQALYGYMDAFAALEHAVGDTIPVDPAAEAVADK